MLGFPRNSVPNEGRGQPNLKRAHVDFKGDVRIQGRSKGYLYEILGESIRNLKDIKRNLKEINLKILKTSKPQSRSIRFRNKKMNRYEI